MNRNLTVKVEKEIEPTTLKTNISSSILQRKPIFCFLLFYRRMEAQIVFIFIKKNSAVIRYHERLYQFQSALWVEIGRFAFDLFNEKLFKVAQVSSTKNRIKQLCERHGLTHIKHKFIFTKHCLI